MGSRKDILKNLGIPEYPWSSDDEEPPADPRPPSIIQRRPSDDEEPPADPRPPSIIQRRPSAHQPTAPTSSPGTSGRNHVQARDLFLSLLNQTGPRNGPQSYTPSTSSIRTDATSLCFQLWRSVAAAARQPPAAAGPRIPSLAPPVSSDATTDDMPLTTYMSRTPHTPAAELREPARRGDLDIQRVLAFKRLTRNINNGRYSRYPTQRGSNTRAGTVVPSESNSSNIRMPGSRRLLRNVTNASVSVRINANREHSQSQPRQSAERRRRRTHSMEVHNSDDEPDDTVEPTSRSAPSAPPADESPAEPEIEAESQVSSNNTSGTGISLEEEIVEIVDEPPDLDLDLIDCSRYKPSPSDPNLASTSRADDVGAPGIEQQNHGVKRKRSESAGEKPIDPFTVKDFNQSLLRLLECPVCLEWMEPPMSQCRRGHLVCSRCRARLASCPVCRTTFSSVRNRAMEGVAEMLRYPCRHGCGREVRLRRRAPHEASCAARKYLCPAPLCADKLPLPRDQLAEHFHSKHLHLVKLGARHHFGIKVSSEAHDNWLIMALDEFFHMKVDVDIRTWGIIVYVAYIGPKCNAVDYAYEVTIDGQHNSRRMLYRRATHSDLESSSLTVSRQDCFHLTLDQALNFIRFKNRHCDSEKFLEFDVEISKIDPPPSRDDSDS